MNWHIAGRTLSLAERTLIMGVLNVTPDSFSDGAKFYSLDSALEHAHRMIQEGADIIDIGGESTRPGAEAVSAAEEIARVVPLIAELVKQADIPISVDTSKSSVAAAALKAGAAIVNDISGLRFDLELVHEVAQAGAGLVLMHSRGTPATMQQLPPVADIFTEVIESLRLSVTWAELHGVNRRFICLDPGIGFSKTRAQNVELIAKLDLLTDAFPGFPFMIGPSRKSFIGHLLADANGEPAPVDKRLHGTMASVTAAVLHGAHIVRVHDVKAAVDTARIADAIKSAVSSNKD